MVNTFNVPKYGDMTIDLNLHGLKCQAHQDSFGPNSKIKLNEHSIFLFCQIISVSLHDTIIYYATIDVLDKVEHIPILPKKEIPPNI